MPRTCSPTERATIAAPHVHHYLYLSVEDADGVLRDCSALGTFSLDLLDGARWGESLDDAVATGSLTIHRDTTDDTAAPTMGASSINRNALGEYAPLFEKGRAVVLSTATVLPGSVPSAGDTKELFRGRINRVQWQANPMTVEIADLGAWLTDAYIQEPTQYGGTKATAPGDGPLLGGVIQAMLDDVAVKNGPVTLYEPEAAAWQPATEPQNPGSLMAAARALAQEIGWELRFRYDAAGVSRLTLYEPDRDNTTPDWVIGPTEYRNVTRLETSIADIRNSIKGYYADSSGVQQQPVVSQDAVSIAKYGLRFMQITSSSIRTATDMQALTDAVLSDLAEAAADQEIEMPYFWPVQIGDVITFQANGDHYDTDQTLAVVGYQHTFQNGEGSTTIQARGRVAGAYRRWLRRGVPSVLTDADQSILKITWEDSADGTQRTFIGTVGSAVATVLATTATVDAPVPRDPLATAAPTAALTPDAATREFRYTVAKPRHGKQVFLRFDPRTVTLMPGASWNYTVDPAPSALAVTIRRIVHNDIADLEITVTGAPSDWPVETDVYEDDPDAPAILTATLTENTTLTKATHPALGGRALPQRALRHWWAFAKNAGGITIWDTAAADRDPLPSGNVTVLDDRAAPKIIVAIDDDTDAFRVTLADGRTKTIATPNGTNAAAYGVGDLLDDGTTESALVVDEARGGYRVEIQGGGTWVTVWGNAEGEGELHGQASNPPTIEILDRGISANGDTASPSFIVRSPVGERVGLFLKLAEGVSAPIYSRTSGSGSTAMGFVDSGTTIGPSDWFSAGGAALQKLNAIPLVHGKLTRITVQVIGEDSGVEGPEIPVTLDPGTTNIEVAVVDNATLAVVVSEPAAFIDATDRIQAYITGADGVRTLTAPTFAPGGIVGTYTFDLTTLLDEKHDTKVEPIVFYADGTSKVLGAWVFDPDLAAEVKATVSYNGQLATVTCRFDTDTVTGAGHGRYRIDGGSWVTFTVGADLLGAFAVTALESGPQTVEVQGQNADGDWGPVETVQIDAYQSPGPSLSVTSVVTSTDVTVTWSGIGTITRKVDSGSYSTPPASPYVVARDTSEHRHTFQAVRAGETKTTEVVIPALAPVSAGTLFSFITIDLFDDVANEMRVLWTYEGEQASTFDVYVDDGTGQFAYKGTTASGATSYTFASFFDLTTNPSDPTATIRAYVVASGGGVSDRVQTTVHHA